MSIVAEKHINAVTRGVTGVAAGSPTREAR